MKRVLVTGATGFIGCHVAPLLAQAGYEVHSLGRTRGPTGMSCQWHACDLLDPASVCAIVREVAATHLLHLAWTMTHGQLWSAPTNLEWVEASLRLFRAFRDGGGERAVFAGTCAEYGWWQPMPLAEREAIVEPATLYGAAKVALYRVLSAAAPLAGVSLAWGRIFHLYGPHEDRRRLVPQIATCLLAGRPFIGTNGEKVRDFMDVHDVARAFAALLDSDYAGAVNIASGSPTMIGDVARILGALSGRPDLLRLGERPDPPGDPSMLTAEVSLLRDRVGFTPQIGLEAGLRDTLAWWREQPA